MEKLHEKTINELFEEEMWDGRIKKYVFGIPKKDLKQWTIAKIKNCDCEGWKRTQSIENPDEYCDSCCDRINDFEIKESDLKWIE